MINNSFKLLVLILSTLVMGAEVDLEKAQRVAGNIYAERSNTGTMDDFNIQSVDIIDENAVNLLYAFQLESEGFILVSGDDRVQPLLAYSFESPFFIEDVPSNVAWMIDAYKKMVKNAIISDESATEKVNAEWEKYFTGNGLNSRNRDIVGPLLESHFNQSANWNDYCPGGTTCSGDQVPNGCVAVAMSAIMHYWAYPVTGEGDNQCYCGGFGTQSADFSEAFYDYGAMGDAGTGGDAASLLTWHAGIAVNMNYDCEGSGAQVTGGYPSTEYAMKNYFKYKSSIYDTYPGAYSDAQWIDKPKPKVKAKRPKKGVGQKENLPLYYELIALALQTDSTRVATSWANGGNLFEDFGLAYPSYHKYSHHGRLPELVKGLLKVELHQMECLAKFLDVERRQNSNRTRIIGKSLYQFLLIGKDLYR